MTWSHQPPWQSAASLDCRDRDEKNRRDTPRILGFCRKKLGRYNYPATNMCHLSRKGGNVSEGKSGVGCFSASETGTWGWREELITPNPQSDPSKERPVITRQRPDEQDEPPVSLRHRVSMSVFLYGDTKHRKSRFWISGWFILKSSSLDTEQSRRWIWVYHARSLPYPHSVSFHSSLHTCGFSFRPRLFFKCLQIFSKRSLLGQQSSVGPLLWDGAFLQNHNLIHLGKKVNAVCNQEASL